VPTEVVETVGSGGTYTTLAAWDTATRTLDLPALDEVRIAEIIQPTPLVLGSLLFLRNTFYGGVSDATRFRWIRPAMGNGYNPSAGTGAALQRTNSVVRIQEDHLRFGHCGYGSGLLGVLMPSSSSTAILRCVRVDRGIWVDSIHAEHNGGSNAANNVFQASVGVTGAATFTNCTAIGSNNTTSTGRVGPRYGFRDLTTFGSGEARFVNCNAYQIRQALIGFPSTSSFGTGFEATGNTNARVINCSAIENGYAVAGNQDFNVGAIAEFRHCVSGDSSATGANSFTGQTAANTWERPAVGAFQPSGAGLSKLINTGTDAGYLFIPLGSGGEFDAAGEQHNLDGFGWEIGAFNFDTSVSPDPAGSIATGPALELLRTLVPDASAAVATSPLVALLIATNPESALATAVGSIVGIQTGVNPAPGGAIALGPAVSLGLTLNPNAGEAVAIAPLVELLVAAALPVVCFELGINRTEALELLISRRVGRSGRVERVLDQALRVGRSRLSSAAIRRTLSSSRIR